MARSRRRQMLPVTLCQADAAGYCGIGVRQFREHIRLGTGPAAFNPSRHRDPEARSMDRFAIVDLDAWIARMRVEARVQSFAAPAPLSPSGAVECEPRSGVGTPPTGPSSPERAA